MDAGRAGVPKLRVAVQDSSLRRLLHGAVVTLQAWEKVSLR